MKNKRQEQIEIPKDKWLRVIGLPVVIILMNLLYLYRGLVLTVGDFLISCFLQMIIGLGYWELQRLVIIKIRQRYPSLQQTPKRITMTFIGFVVVMFLTFPLIFWLFDTLDYPAPYDPKFEDYVFQFIIGFIMIVIFGSIYEALYYFRLLHKAYNETDELRKINLQIQLDSLKNQVNPHFLFNALNSLSSLISENPKLAETFVDEMASVYRYLLQNNEKELTTLKAELNFIASYFHLLQTRYGAGIALNIDVPLHYLTHKIPPLTLQLLVENAVKHNAISAKTPLKIDLFIQDNKALVVKNNVQKKSISVLSNKVGLANIMTKYALLGAEPVQILNDDVHFRVVLPLISVSL
jgi:sensor histidine kinase YesM